ncbi:MAG: ABC transporter substrate-binding protein [Solirubrobacterales bacterium]|nr:ABC transporter substrate-binding protein [Solirubrobacterales bacterium]
MRSLGLRVPCAVVLAAFMSTVVVATGCGSSDSGSSTTSSSTGTTAGGLTATKDDAIAASVPEKYKSAGKLTVAADASYAPMEFIDEGSKAITGADVDLASALGAVMGLKADVQNASFDAIIPGLASGKYDLGMSSFTDTKEREATVDFVTYFSAGTSFFGKSDAPTVSGLADLCGLTVAVEKGTTQADDAAAQSKSCVTDGKKEVNVLVFPDQNGANSALISGRAQLSMADSPVAAYQVTLSKGQLKLVGTPYGTAPYGIAIPKQSGLAEPVLAAVKKLIEGGQYAAILKKWGLDSGAVTDPKVNGATS